MNSKQIYLDHAATTPIAKEVSKAIIDCDFNNFGNPSSSHFFGRKALSAIDATRQNISKFLNCAPDEIIFTSGATEANNLAINGIAASYKNPHIITTSFEHKSILEVSKKYQVSYLKNFQDFEKHIQENTVLVSVMYANNETGNVFPVRSLAKKIRKINEDREKAWKNSHPSSRGERPNKIYFHTDATQAVGFLNCDIEWNYFDLLNLSAHKIYGPKGVGALFVKKGVKIFPVQLGGSQELGRRAGTLNTAGIVGLGKAIELLQNKKILKINNNLKSLRDNFAKNILDEIKIAKINTDLENSLPHILNISFPGYLGEMLEIALDMQGVAVSGKSACMSGAEQESYVLKAMGKSDEVARSSLRFSLGRNTTKQELNYALKVLKKIINKS